MFIYINMKSLRLPLFLCCLPLAWGLAAEPSARADERLRSPRTGELPRSASTSVDGLGRTQLRYDNGVTSVSATDALGGVTTRYSNGITATGRTDALGVTTTRYSNGLTATSRQDALGRTETVYSDGTRATTRVDFLGNQVTTYVGGRTEVVRPDPFAVRTSAPADPRQPARR